MAGALNDVEQAKRLERSLVRVRWFAVVLGVYLVSQSSTGLRPYPSHAVTVAGYAVFAVTAAVNLAVQLLVDGARTPAQLRRLGLAVFVFDTCLLFTLSWLFSFDPKGQVWVVIYILPLEGALRYRLKGALVAVGLTLVSETAREFYLAARFPSYPFLVSNVAFRVGIQAIVGLVAGVMARSLARQADRASEQAQRFQEAARREGLARRELAAFNTAILTGVAAEQPDASIQLMASAVGRDLAFETFTILLIEDGGLVIKGSYGISYSGGPIALGTGITGTAAATGRPLLVPDVSAFDGYVEADPDIRSEMAAPLRIGEEVIGVVDVESSSTGTFDEAALALLTRLADQVALVIHSAQLRARQEETLRRLQELDQMKSDFVAIASHELRTPLTAIHGYVTTLARRFDSLGSDEVHRFLDTITRQSERMTRLVEDLLLVSRIEAGTIRIQPRPVEVGPFLDEVVEALPPGDRARIRLQAMGPDGRIDLDADRLGQVVHNLIANALKFSPPDSVVTVRSAMSEKVLTLSVSDLGMGIAPDDIPRLFDRFHQAGHVTTREAQGAGLGLYISKRLVEAMGGSIDVRSAPGSGSTFTVQLPVSGDGASVEPPSGVVRTPR
jgi:signal transduction histidine kinase